MKRTGHTPSESIEPHSDETGEQSPLPTGASDRSLYLLLAGIIGLLAICIVFILIAS